MRHFRVIRQDLYNGLDAYKFADELSAASEEGYTVESCGMNSEGYGQAWAILSKAVEETPKPFDMLEAARLIAAECKKHTNGCLGCPLDTRNQCLASGGLLPAYWTITKEG